MFATYLFIGFITVEIPVILYGDFDKLIGKGDNWFDAISLLIVTVKNILLWPITLYRAYRNVFTNWHKRAGSGNRSSFFYFLAIITPSIMERYYNNILEVFIWIKFDTTNLSTKLPKHYWMQWSRNKKKRRRLRHNAWVSLLISRGIYNFYYRE